MAIEFRDSAGKHGFNSDDAIHAVNNHTGYMPEFDDSRSGGPRPHLAIGPAVDGREIEVMFEVYSDTGTVSIFHCMPAREKLKRILEEGESQS